MPVPGVGADGGWCHDAVSTMAATGTDARSGREAHPVPDGRTRSGGAATAEPGWYPDPYFRGYVRRWDGDRWGGHVRPAGTPGGLDGARLAVAGARDRTGQGASAPASGAPVLLAPALRTPALRAPAPVPLLDAVRGAHADVPPAAAPDTGGHQGRRSARRRRHPLVGPLVVAVAVVLVAVVASQWPRHSGAATASSGDGAAFPHDAPDPDVVVVGSTYYAYTTGTTWGNSIAVLRSSSPASGWTPAAVTPHGSSALPSPPPWQEPGTQNAPGVVRLGGRFVMYYDAIDQQAPYRGLHCLSVATAPDPQGPFVDISSGPMYCDPDGSIDPDPTVAPGGQPWLAWKSNDGSSTQSAEIWSAPLDAQGMGLAGSPQVLLVQDLSAYPWEATVEAPDLVTVNGVTYLFFSAGLWGSPSYSEHYAVCLGVSGPCSMTNPDPILASGGRVAGPGSATAFQDTAGNWWMAYDAWDAGCTSYACGGARQLYVRRLTFAAAPAPCPTASATACAGRASPTATSGPRVIRL